MSESVALLWKGSSDFLLKYASDSCCYHLNFPPLHSKHQDTELLNSQLPTVTLHTKGSYVFSNWKERLRCQENVVVVVVVVVLM